MSKRIYFIPVIFILFSACVNVNALAAVGQDFILSAYSGKKTQVKEMLFNVSETDVTDAMKFFKALLPARKEIISIENTGYRAVLYKKMEIHSLWYVIKTEKKKVYTALFFVYNDGWKILSYQIGKPPVEW